MKKTNNETLGECFWTVGYHAVAEVLMGPHIRSHVSLSHRQTKEFNITVFRESNLNIVLYSKILICAQ